MEYRRGVREDFPKIKALVDATGYYSELFPENIGGHWFVAEHVGEIHACAWCMIEKPNAYLDYWVGTGCTALRLLANLEKAFEVWGITLVRAIVHESNKPAIRSAMALGAYGQTGYAILYKEIKDGQANDNDN